MNKKESIQQPVFYMMLTLLDGEKHGYAMMKDVETVTNGRFKLGPASLYRHIRNLLEKGLIEEVPPPDDATSTDERRKYYALTHSGKTAVADEITYLEAITQLARGKLVVGS